MANSKKSVFSKFGPLAVRKEIKIYHFGPKRFFKFHKIGTLYNLTMGNANMEFIYLNFVSSGGQKGTEAFDSKIV